ncbi:hypothetical protein BRY73_15710 [Ochrobactrum sp. P6BS-III]|uniref:hypothetical protein n=1 Tax=unclassified Ochrobactrum TaxID=239106 RepID=UPI0009921488|nr:hypothetical protein [Ochrobactrum sp. P6BSIII]OOL16180.1 hypothetical protein BRY73_15710 [Ochrobactrum sp. P6BS-III]
MKPLVAIALAFPLLAACQREKTTGPYEISGRLVVFNYRIARATFLVTLRKIGPLEEGATVTAAFDNPAQGAPVVVDRKVFPNQDQLSLETEPLHCIVKDKPYDVSIRVTARNGDLLQTLATTVVSSEDQSILPAEPLVVGPFYDPNPKVFKPDGSRDFSPEKNCPKA